MTTRRCGAFTKAGDPCRATAQRDSRYCATHRGRLCEQHRDLVVVGTWRVDDTPDAAVLVHHVTCQRCGLDVLLAPPADSHREATA